MVAYEREQSIVRVVQSLPRLGPNLKLAIHDNSAVPLHFTDVRRIADEFQLPIRIEHCLDNCGFARACNSLARSSDATVLLFLNPDAEVMAWPGRFQIAGTINGIIGPRIVDDQDRALATYGRRRTIAEEFFQRWARVRPSMPMGEGYVSGAALLVQRNDFLALNGFDESFFMYYEDIDLCLRANQSGIPVTVEPSWVVRHEGGHAAKRDSGTALIRSYDSARYFYSKHGGNVALYRGLCWFDAIMRLALFSILPARRSSVPAVRRLLAHISTTQAIKLGSSARTSENAS